MAAWDYGTLIGTDPHPDAVLAGESLARLIDAREAGDDFELWDTLLGRVIRSFMPDPPSCSDDPINEEVEAALFDRNLEAVRPFLTVSPVTPAPETSSP